MNNTPAMSDRDLSDKEYLKLNRIPIMWEIMWREIKRDKFALITLFVFIALMAVTFIGAQLVDQDIANRITIPHRDLSPSEWGRLGTDDGGRDMIEIMLLSARNSIAIAFIVTIAITIIANFTGLVAGFYAGYLDLIIMRIIDFFVMIPTLMVIILLVSILPNYDIQHFILIMIAMNWFAGARGTRARVLQEGAKDYVFASKTLGTPNFTIMIRKIFPNVVSFIMVGFILSMAGNIGMETGLTVIGYGLPFGTPSIGRLISLAMNPIVLRSRWWQWVPAAGYILLVSLCIYGVGFAISRAVNPRQRR